MMTKRAHLTDKRLRFVREYCVDLNGTQAAIRAGYAPHTAGRTGWKLLRDPEIIALVHKRSKAINAKVDVTAERVVEELARIGYANITSFVHVLSRKEGRREVSELHVLPTDAMTVDQRAAIAELSEGENGIRVKLHDKTKALELLGKYLALWQDRTELTGAVDGPLVVVLPPEKPA